MYIIYYYVYNILLFIHLIKLIVFNIAYYKLLIYIINIYLDVLLVEYKL